MNLVLQLTDTIETQGASTSFPIEDFRAIVKASFDGLDKFKAKLDESTLLYSVINSEHYYFTIKKQNEDEVSLHNYNLKEFDPTVMVQLLETIHIIEKELSIEIIARKISHDIANPLTAIIMNTDYVKRKLEMIQISDIAEIFESLDGTKNSSNKLRKMITDFRDQLVKNDFGFDWPKLEKFNLNQILLFMLHQRLSRYINANLICILNVGGDHLPNLEPEFLYLILYNLIKNSIENQQGGKFTAIRVSTTPNELIYYDNCKSMDETTRIKSKLPLYTTSKNHFGIGLTIIDKILARKSGTLSILALNDGIQIVIGL